MQVNAPAKEAEHEAKDAFYVQLQSALDAALKHNLLIALGDWNAKVCETAQGNEATTGKHPLTGWRG